MTLHLFESNKQFSPPFFICRKTVQETFIIRCVGVRGINYFRTRKEQKTTNCIIFIWRVKFNSKMSIQNE